MSDASTQGEAGDGGSETDQSILADEIADDATSEDFLFAAGPLHEVQLTPAKSRIPPGTARALRARARDASGRTPTGEVAFAWRIDGAGELTGDGARAVYTAPAQPTRAHVIVTASQGPIRCEARASLDVTDETAAGRNDQGIPEPRPVHAASEAWRSRLRDRQWEYNTGHRDYVASTTNESRRLRYLVHLFAKEVVLRNFGQPADTAILERMVEILTYLQEAQGTRLPLPHSAASTHAASGEAGK